MDLKDADAIEKWPVDLPAPPEHLSAPLDDLLAPLGAGVQIDLDAGAFLWREDDAADSVALLREGVLEVISESADNDDIIVLRELAPGALLGEIACLDRGYRSAGIRARTRAGVTLYPAAEFRALLRQSPSLFEALLVQQVATVRRLTAQVTRQHRRAITDQLTSLYNLGFFVERLGLELQRAEKTGDTLAVIMADIDHFKRFNDTHGHQAGNHALKHLGQIFKRCGRRGDIAARYGGEEFITLLYGATRGEAAAFAERLRYAVESADFADDGAGRPRRITLSAGVACFPDDATALNPLLLAADANLYRAKEQGRNRVVVGLS